MTEDFKDRRDYTPKLERQKFKPGERVFHEGEHANCAYIVETGVLEIFKQVDGEAVTVGTLGKGELFGEMALINDHPRTATVRVVQAATLAIIPRDVFLQRLEKIDPVIRRVLNVLSDRLRHQTDAVLRKTIVIR